MHSLRRSRVGMLAAGSVVLAGLGATGAVAAEPMPTSVVEDGSSWHEQAYDNFATGGYLTPQQADVPGPQRAPFGSSSHKITIGESSLQTELYRTDDFDGTALKDITRLEYSSFASRTADQGDTRQPTALRLTVDNGDSLFFFPANNTGQNAPANGQWQHWNVAEGNVSVSDDAGSTQTFADYVAAHPVAKLMNNGDGTHDGGAVALVTGGALGGDTDPQTKGTYYVDRVIVGVTGQNTLFDFGGSDEAEGVDTVRTVEPGSLQGWVHQAYDLNTDKGLDTDQTFVGGPEDPSGDGSLRFPISDNTNPNRVEQFRTPAYDGTLLRDVRSLGFSTFQRATGTNESPQQPVYLRLNLDNDGDGTRDTSLYYIPANNGDVEQSSWQDWSTTATSGKWSVDGDSGAAETVTLQDFVVAHPDATIVNNAGGDAVGGGVAFLVGGAGDAQLNGEYFLDDITIDKVQDDDGSTYEGTRFDLEPTAPPVQPAPPAPTLSIGDTSVSEGNNGATLRFPVTLSHKVAHAVTVAYATSNDTAKSGSDFQAKSGTVIIPAGSTSGTVSVTVVSDKTREADERMNVTLSSPGNATLDDASAKGTIVNDDTRVGLGLAIATHHRIRANVDTLTTASGSPVKVYRVTKSGSTRLLSSNLNRYGRISAVLGSYKPGTKVTLYTTVQTAKGLYTSGRATITSR